MKAIAALRCKWWKYLRLYGKDHRWELQQQFAIPTTARYRIRSNTVYDHHRYTNDVKMLLKGAVLMPDYAIIDPQFTMTAPPKDHSSNRIRCTDTCSRSVYIKLAQPLSDTFALSAIKRIFKYHLPVAFHDGKNVEAKRTDVNCCVRSGESALTMHLLHWIHGMSRPIGHYSM